MRAVDGGEGCGFWLWGGVTRAIGTCIIDIGGVFELVIALEQ